MHQPQACFRGQEHWLAHDFDTLMARERFVSTRESTWFIWLWLFMRFGRLGQEGIEEMFQ